MLKNEKRQSVLLKTFGLFFRYFRLLLQKYLSLPASFSKRVFFSGSSQSQRGTFFPFPPDYGGNPQKNQPPHHPFSLPPFSIAFSGGKLGTGLPFRTPPPLFPLLPWGLEGGLGFGREREGMGRKGGERNCTAIGLVGEKGCLERNGFVCSSCANTSFSKL